MSIVLEAEQKARDEEGTESSDEAPESPLAGVAFFSEEKRRRRQQVYAELRGN